MKARMTATDVCPHCEWFFQRGDIGYWDAAYASYVCAPCHSILKGN
jgi:transposase-like protein